MIDEINTPSVWVPEHINKGEYLMHGVTKVLAHAHTEYQEMILVESASRGRALVLDGMWQSCEGDEFLYHEPLVHPGCVVHGSPRTALILGGGEGATTRELLKWNTIERVVMVDIDDQVVEACKKYLPSMHQGSYDDPRFELVVGDALKYIDETDTKWDIVISDLSDPIEEGPSFQLFTKEYYERIKKIMAPDGVFVVQAGPTGPGEMRLHVRLVNTLATIFPYWANYCSHIPSYFNPWGFCICSEKEFSLQPDPAAVDQILAEKTTGDFRMFDGRTLLGLFQPPKHLREAIEKETQIFTMAEPPKFFSNLGKPIGSSNE